MSECEHEWARDGVCELCGIGADAYIAQLEAYCDKLAMGLPDGMLPKDVEVLRKANHDFVEENAALKLAVQAAIDYFEDGTTSKEQYDAYQRFVDAAQPFFVVATHEQGLIFPTIAMHSIPLSEEQRLYVAKKEQDDDYQALLRVARAASAVFNEWYGLSAGYEIHETMPELEKALEEVEHLL